jgi:BlaI family transcriptional regulator, penicillinase repressor
MASYLLHQTATKNNTCSFLTPTYENIRTKTCIYELLRSTFVLRNVSYNLFAMLKPTESELEVLQILWKNGEPMSVRAINDLLNQQREVGYTTTLKIMQLMTEKGILSREEDGRQHLYQPIVEESATQSQLIQTLVNNAFQGSMSKLVLQALGNHQASNEELEEIKRVIAQVENRQNN